jgi:ferredoxin
MEGSGSGARFEAAEPEAGASASARPAIKVRVMPLDVEIEVAAEESLLEAALRGGFAWPNVCGGHATCGTCYVRVEAGLEAAGAESAWERERLDLAGRRDAEFRLACQIRPQGTMRVLKRGLRPPTTSHDEETP